MTRKVLFLCTGNYYRSRFAELLFNTRAAAEGLPWWAYSRGLALEKGVNNVGPMSRHALQALQELGIRRHDGHRYPLQVEDADFSRADVIIALQYAEHHPYIRDRYPAWVERVQYWHVHDREPTLAYNPLKEIASEMQQFIRDLSHLPDRGSA